MSSEQSKQNVVSKRPLSRGLRRLMVAALLLLTAHCSLLTAETIADKTVASVTNGARATPDLITYSDLVWQLALEPERALVVVVLPACLPRSR